MPQIFDFFYDLGSPYSYLASTQLAGIEQRTGARARLLPITLGGLRKATGHQIPPPQQLKYMSEDTARWAHQYGVRMQIPKAVPISTIQDTRQVPIGTAKCSPRMSPGRRPIHRSEPGASQASAPTSAMARPMATRSLPTDAVIFPLGAGSADGGFQSLLAPWAVIRDPLSLLDADRLAADEAGLAGAAVDPEPDGAERVAGTARPGGPVADQEPGRSV